MPAKKVLTALLIIAVATGGFITGLILLKQEQNITEKAAVPGGEATVGISPSSGTYNVGATFKSSVSFNTASIPIDGIAIRLSYPYSGTSPELSVQAIDINSALISSGEWTCPTKTFNLQGGKVLIDIACGNISATGFSSSTDTLFADITFKVERVPALGKVVVSFDPNLSLITKKSDHQDILLIPTSTGAYSVPGSASPTVSPIPTITGALTPTPTSRLTPTPTRVLSPTPTSRLSVTPTPKLTTVLTVTPTGVEELPEAGISYPTFVSMGLGALLLIGGLLLAL